MREETGFLCMLFNKTAYSSFPGFLPPSPFLGGGGVISDKCCFIVLHLVIKPADVTSAGFMFNTNVFPSFYSLSLCLFLSAYPPHCRFHPCSNQLDSQVSTLSFSSNCLSLLSSIYCLHLFNKHISEMVFLWPSHSLPPDPLISPPRHLVHFIACLGKFGFMRMLYRWEKAKKMEISHC